MRLRCEQALLLLDVMRERAAATIYRRADAQDRGDVESVTLYNRRLTLLRDMMAELERLIREMSW